MALFQTLKDYVFAFCLYVLFVAWNIHGALTAHSSTHNSSLIVASLSGIVIVYVLFQLMPLFKKTSANLEKTILGLTVGICALELFKLLPRFGIPWKSNLLSQCIVISINCAAALLAVVRMSQVVMSRQACPK
jgi:hypothetical protein